MPCNLARRVRPHAGFVRLVRHSSPIWWWNGDGRRNKIEVMKKRFEQTQRFRTKSCDGNECYIVELTTFGRIESEPDTRWLPVNRVFRTAEGKPVQLRPDGAFVVVATGARFERV